MKTKSPGKAVKCKISQYNFLNTPYVVGVYMGHGFALLIPFSISVAQKLLNPLLRAENQVFSKSCNMRDFAKYIFLKKSWLTGAWLDLVGKPYQKPDQY